MRDRADIIIVGAGIIGMCAALQLARRTPAKIIVLEKGQGPGEGSTGASSAVCRFRYTRDETVLLARDGINAYQNWSDFLGLTKPLATYHWRGNLWLGDHRPDWAAQEVKRLARLGVRAEALDDKMVEERFPALSTCAITPDLAAARPHACRGGANHLLELDGGYVDPNDALLDLIKAAKGVGVDVRFRSEVGAVAVESGEVKGVSLKDGATLSCGVLINAAGPWCNTLFDLAGVACPWPLKPIRIQIAHIERPPEVPGEIPICADLAGGIYFRSQNAGQQIIVGSILEEDEQEVVSDPDNFATFADDDFIHAKLYALQHRIPSLSRIRSVRGYSGLYTMNQTDLHPLVGATPLKGFYAANGCSGHGFKLAPAIGSLLAQEITGETCDSFDTAVSRRFLAFDRAPIEISSKSVLA